jgi:hypothetical protein
MSSAILERSQFAAAGHAAAGAPGTAGTPATGNWCVVPRCTMKVEKCAGGMKLNCVCDDEVSCLTLQNLCKALSNGLCSCTCTLNGMTVCMCNLNCGFCVCEPTKDGVCISCKSGDKACCDMIQACCDCLAKCLSSGCSCYVSFQGTPVCCGCC